MVRVQDPPAPERPANDKSVLVPLVDETSDGCVYESSVAIFALVGMGLGAVLLGWLGWALADGAVAVTGLGQWAASGVAVGTFTGAGIGAAIGALVGALFALYRLPARSSPAENER